MLKVAVIGAGISGISASYHLQKFAEVTLFEKNDAIGGHANTVSITDDETGSISVDTGFIVFNDRNYPGFSQFLSELGIQFVKTDMTFSFTNCKSGFSYAGSLRGLFPEIKDLFNMARLKFLKNVLKYSKHLQQNSLACIGNDLTINDALRKSGCPENVITQYFVPLASAIWSCSGEDAGNVPIDSFVTFFNNHGLFDLTGRPNWYSVKGGSESYIDAFKKSFKGIISCNSEVNNISKNINKRYEVQTVQGSYSEYDSIVFATHANDSIEMLKTFEDINTEIMDVLHTYRFTQNQVVLHEDTTFLPNNYRLWSSWNVKSDPLLSGGDIGQTTYFMNRLQKLNTDRKLLVTLNPITQPKESTVLYRTSFSHPVLTSTLQDLGCKFEILNSQDKMYFCGAYTGYGFHEDGYQSGYRVSEVIKKYEHLS